jgi:hypothetical protein
VVTDWRRSVVAAIASAAGTPGDLRTDGRPARLSAFEIGRLSDCPAWAAEDFTWISPKMAKGLARRALAQLPVGGTPSPVELVAMAVDHEARQQTSYGTWLEGLDPIARSSAMRGAVAIVHGVLATVDAHRLTWHTGKQGIEVPPGVRAEIDPDGRHLDHTSPKHWLVMLAPANPAVVAALGALVYGRPPAIVAVIDPIARRADKVPVDDALLSDGTSLISGAVAALGAQRHGSEPQPVPGVGCRSCRHRATCPALAAP